MKCQTKICLQIHTNMAPQNTKLRIHVYFHNRYAFSDFRLSCFDHCKFLPTFALQAQRLAIRTCTIT